MEIFFMQLDHRILWKKLHVNHRWLVPHVPEAGAVLGREGSAVSPDTRGQAGGRQWCGLPAVG